MMDHIVPRERDISVDLESGGTTSEEEGGYQIPVSGVRQANKYLGKVWSGILNVDEHTLRSSNNVSISDDNEEDFFIDKGSGGEQNVGLLLNKTIKENRKKAASNKAPKPPRPPRGPSLDAADQKLVREISQLAMLKRARRDRIKAHKKMKATKTSSSSSSSYNTTVCAMIVTVLFCLIIFFQGMFSRHSSHASFAGSPESAAITRGALISVQYYKSPSASSSAPSSGSPNLVELVSGSSPGEERSRVTG